MRYITNGLKIEEGNNKYTISPADKDFFENGFKIVLDIKAKIMYETLYYSFEGSLLFEDGHIIDNVDEFITECANVREFTFEAIKNYTFESLSDFYIFKADGAKFETVVLSEDEDILSQKFMLDIKHDMGFMKLYLFTEKYSWFCDKKLIECYLSTLI